MFILDQRIAVSKPIARILYIIKSAHGALLAFDIEENVDISLLLIFSPCVLLHVVKRVSRYYNNDNKK